MKVAINRCFGGFGLSEEAYKELGLEWDTFGYEYDDDEKRSDPALIAAIEKLGNAASGRMAEVIVVDVPDDVKWHIHNYDGMEDVAENHRIWPEG